ncbi:MAG: hypothetical protein IBX61_08585, partial [Thermoleophilia bacterium]|nr:hypothetical protein [Thermoleophilia bacterium]
MAVEDIDVAAAYLEPEGEAVDVTGGAADSGDESDSGGAADSGDKSDPGGAADSGDRTSQEAETGTGGADEVISLPVQATSEDSAAGPAIEEDQGSGNDEVLYKLVLQCNYNVYWASMEDYEAGLLTIDYLLTNVGDGTAYDVAVTGAVASDGATVWTDPLPSLGDLAPGESLMFTLVWQVPEGVGSFLTTIDICASCEQYLYGGEDKNGDNGENGDRNIDGVEDEQRDSSSATVATPPPPGQGSMLPASLPSTGIDGGLVRAVLVMLTILGGGLSIRRSRNM